MKETRVVGESGCNENKEIMKSEKILREREGGDVQRCRRMVMYICLEDVHML